MPYDDFDQIAESLMFPWLDMEDPTDTCDDFNEPFDRDGWDDEEALASAGLGMDESYGGGYDE